MVLVRHQPKDGKREMKVGRMVERTCKVTDIQVPALREMRVGIFLPLLLSSTDFSITLASRGQWIYSCRFLNQ